MSSNPTTALLPILPLTLSAVLSGAILTLSGIGVPVICLAPQPLLLKQYVELYRRGRNTAPPLAILTLLSSAYLAYTSPSSTSSISVSSMWLLSGALTLAIVPFTLTAMKHVNGELHRREKVVESEGVKGGSAWEEETRVLVTRWAWLNAARGMLPLAGSLVGWIALGM